MLGMILIVVLLLMLLGAWPSWPHSRNWGYYPSGGLGLVVLIVIILMFVVFFAALLLPFPGRANRRENAS